MAKNALIKYVIFSVVCQITLLSAMMIIKVAISFHSWKASKIFEKVHNTTDLRRFNIETF